MARRNNGILDGLIDTASKLPWWLGMALAIAAYLILHPYAIRELPASTGLADAGKVAVAQMAKTLAFYGQYVIPLALLAGSVISIFKRRKRAQLMAQTQARANVGSLLGMSWREFEMLVGEAFRRQGYRVAEIGGNGPDGGVDLELRKGDELHLVQCKQWKATKVGVDVVRELYGVMAARGATGGVVVTAGQYTADAVTFAQGQNIRLIDGEKLLGLIAAGDLPARETAVPKQTASAAVPNCPRCGGAMVRRIAKQGGNAGNAFWGCASYPKCRGTVSITDSHQLS